MEKNKPCPIVENIYQIFQIELSHKHNSRTFLSSKKAKLNMKGFGLEWQRMYTIGNTSRQGNLFAKPNFRDGMTRLYGLDMLLDSGHVRVGISSRGNGCNRTLYIVNVCSKQTGTHVTCFGFGRHFDETSQNCFESYKTFSRSAIYSKWYLVKLLFAQFQNTRIPLQWNSK